MEEMIENAEKLCEGLQKMSDSEINICQDTAMLLEQYSWELYRMVNNLKEIQCMLHI
jgi:hypothetical protein